ncbi:MAG: pyridoxal-dependent decarboxylase [Eubacteriales bacterium]|nr:pyridoxal-dependent decarboxylase [Eubacteriales bacterium]
MIATPYYYIDETALDGDIAMLQEALRLSWGENAVASYSVKTNALPWLLQHLHGRGFYAEIVSETEYDLVRRLGFPEEHMIYNGPIKDREIFERILLAGGYVNMDSSQEPDWLEALAAAHPERTFDVGVRVNFDIASLVPDEVLADEEGSRFGYCYENGELRRVIGRVAELPNVRLAGLHLHSSTKSRSVKVFAALARAAVKIAGEYNLSLSYIDMGGGYFGGRAGMPDYRDYMPAIAEELRKGFSPEETALLVEPGVSLISRATSFVTSVRDVKHIRDHVYVVTDGGRVNLNPQVTRRSYPHHLVYMGEAATEREILPSQMICGYTCMEYDRLFEERGAAQLREGDLVVYDTAGGYTMCLNPLFIQYLPAVWIGREDGSLFQAREAWGNDEFLRKNRIE